METDLQDAWRTIENFIKVLGPFAGMYFAARVVISYQKDLLGSLQKANGDLREEIHEQDERIDLLEQKLDAVRADLRDEREWCDETISELREAMRQNGLTVPPSRSRPAPRA